MGVFKWLRRERVTVTSRRGLSPGLEDSHSAAAVGTIRTEEYKRDLAEFQARRSGSKHDFDTPVKRKCGRHSLPVSCTDCTADHDNTFNYEKKSGSKYKKKQKRARSASEDPENLPNIQFLFQNQVFMPGNMFAAYSEPNKTKRRQKQTREPTPEVEFFTQKRIDFNEDSSPLFYKNNSLPYDVSNFLDNNEVDVVVAGGDFKGSRSSRSPSKEDSCSDKLIEVMSELKNLDQWADEQLNVQSLNYSKCDDSKSDTSAYGLPIVTISDLDVSIDKQKPWSHGRWGSVPVQMRKLSGVSIAHVRRRQNTEVDILRKCRHPNIILLMGLYPDVHGDVHIICERCVDSLFNILHVQGRILSAQTAVQYNLDIANALAFLRMRGYIHTELTSHAVMLTNRDAAKLADFMPCVKVVERDEGRRRFDTFSAQPQYVNIGGPRLSSDTSPLLSTTSSDAYLLRHSVLAPHDTYRNSPRYRWHAPELFMPEDGYVRPCERSDVYSLTLLLWETCNASIPWKTQTYQQLLELYTVWRTGLPLPSDGTYPGCLLSWLQAGLALCRADRPSLAEALDIIRTVKQQLDELDYVIIPSRVAKKQVFSTTAWESPDSDQSPVQADIEHIAEIHKHTTDAHEHTADVYEHTADVYEHTADVYEHTADLYAHPTDINKHTADLHKLDSETDDEFSRSEECSPVYESIKERRKVFAESSLVSDSDDRPPTLNYEKIEGYSSACSTPISKVKTRIRDIGTPGTLHRSDSTEYCSILSPDGRQIPNDISNDTERPNTKLSRSFTPKSYKPLHITVPDFNLDSLKALPKEQNMNRSSYNFRIKNYSLPSTPIARSNKLRKNAWLSGELMEREKTDDSAPSETKDVQSAPDTPAVTASLDKAASPKVCFNNLEGNEERTPESVATTCDSYTGLRRTSQDSTPEHQESRSWSFKSSAGTLPKRRESEPTPNKSRPADEDLSPAVLSHKPRLSDGDPMSLVGAGRRPLHEELSSLARSYKSRMTDGDQSPQGKQRPMDDDLAAVLVKPLVQIHEKWIMEANRKAGRSVSLPTDNRYQMPAVKPASHCVDTLQKSLPQLSIKRPMNKLFKNSISLSPTATATASGRNGWQSEQFCQARDNIAKSINFATRETETCVNRTWKKESDKCINTIPVEIPEVHPKMDQATDTRSIEEFIKDLIRKEFQHLLRDITDDVSVETQRSEELLNKGMANVLDALKTGSDDTRKDTVKTFSRVKINGNNKPLLQITFSRSGENSLQVLDNSVNVTFCGEGRERDRDKDRERDKPSQPLEETLMDECHVHSLKRCQAYNAIQEARSTEDLYIDDDLSTQMQENFGGKVKLIPLHGSLHEILCEREDDCCLLKVKQENGCDTIYFRCDNSDTESRDAIDGLHEDTVVYKRSISLVEERFERVIQKDKPALRKRLRDPPSNRPKSEIILKQITRESRVLSNSSPSLTTKGNDEVEVNIENVMSYDSSSDENIKCDHDDFERLEKEIEEDIANDQCASCHKISDDTLSVIHEESEREQCSDSDAKVGM